MKILLLFVVTIAGCDSIGSSISTSDCGSCYFEEYVKNSYKEFHQRNKVFWEFNEETKSWVQVKLPYDLVSCQEDGCRVVGLLHEIEDEESKNEMRKKRKRRRWSSLTKMSEISLWVTGQSGSIYERYWNGMQWVIAPHSLPSSAGYATSVFFFNHTVLALAQSGLLYQMQALEESQSMWIELKPEIDKGESKEVHFSCGISQDMETLHLLTKNGFLLQLIGLNPPRLSNHGRPPGENIVAVADGSIFKLGLLFGVSDVGDLYEFDQTTKPSWKKHILIEETGIKAPLTPATPCTVKGDHYASVFLLRKGGELIERRLHQRKWKWIVHGKPNGHELTSITCTYQEHNYNQESASLFFTTDKGSIFEYHIPMHNMNSKNENWENHAHPEQAKVAHGISGLQLQADRMLFPLEDGRIGELHYPGFGGLNIGPYSATGIWRKAQLKYIWTLLDAPETEGWNAEYCSEKLGPSNCVHGTKDEKLEVSSSFRWRKENKAQQNYMLPSPGTGVSTYTRENKIHNFFRLRLIQEGASFFFISENGMTLEYLHSENMKFWLKHDHASRMMGAVGYYNGSLFLVDEEGSLLLREGKNSELVWLNCTALKKGSRVIGGRPWESVPGETLAAKEEDSLFFVSRSGRLLQFTVSLKKFKWKDCKNPSGIRVANIIDQEISRNNIVFVVGQNGKLYQYNKVTELWHEHHQSQHLILSKSPGTATKKAVESLRSSIFMLSVEGGLVEYKWTDEKSWNWIEHGTPRMNVKLVGAPGPCFEGNQLFLIGSDGNVHLRMMDQGEWKWIAFGSPNDYIQNEFHGVLQKDDALDKHCLPKIASTRPIPFSEDAVIFELEDGRLAEMQRMNDKGWKWSRIIATPTSLCPLSFHAL